MIDKEIANRERFVKLSEARVTNALKAIHLIGNLSNQATYQYSKGDIAKIFKALDDEIGSVRQRFEHKDGNREIRFTLE